LLRVASSQVVVEYAGNHDRFSHGWIKMSGHAPYVHVDLMNAGGMDAAEIESNPGDRQVRQGLVALPTLRREVSFRFHGFKFD